MLLLNLIPLIDVTFSTPTAHSAQKNSVSEMAISQHLSTEWHRILRFTSNRSPSRPSLQTARSEQQRRRLRQQRGRRAPVETSRPSAKICGFALAPWRAPAMRQSTAGPDPQRYGARDRTNPRAYMTMLGIRRRSKLKTLRQRTSAVETICLLYTSP